MKSFNKILVAAFAAILMLGPVVASAQTEKNENPKKRYSMNRAKKTEVTIYSGWFFAGYVNGYDQQLWFDNDYNLGVAFSHAIEPGYHVEFFYERMNTEASTRRYGSGYNKYAFDVSIDYYQIGVNREVFLGGPIVPFGSFSIGLASFIPRTYEYSTRVVFAATMGGGIKIFMTDAIGLRIGGRFMLPMQFAGGGFYWGSGGGGIGIGTSTSVIQGELTAGILLAL
jgi:hypothetical protein